MSSSVVVPSKGPHPQPLDLSTTEISPSTVEQSLTRFIDKISQFFFKNEMRSGIRLLMILSAILITIASILLSPSVITHNGHDQHIFRYGNGNNNHNPEYALFGNDKYSRMFVYGLSFSIIVALPSIVDLIISFFFLRVQDHIDSSVSAKLPREYTRICIIFTIVIPNFLLFIEILPPIIIDYVMFCQYIIISFAIVYRIFSLTTTQHRELPIGELYGVFIMNIITLLFAFGYKLSLHNVINHDAAHPLKHAYTSSLMIVQILTVLKLRSWLYQTNKLAKIISGTNQNKELSDQKVSFYSLMFCILMSLGMTVAHSLTFPLEYVYFPRNTDCYVIMEWVICTFLFELIAIRDYEVRRSELATTDQLVYNRKMTRSISHEIRTPLNTAFMALELLITSLSSSIESGGNNSSPRSTKTKIGVECSPSNAVEEGSNLLEIAESIKEGCDIALNILNQLLTFEKLSAGMLQLENKLLTTENMLASNMKLFKMQAQQSGIEFKLDPGNVSLKHLYVYIDEHKMNQVLRNLLSNAMKFTPKGGLVQVKLQWIPTKDRDETIAALTQDSPRTVSTNASTNSICDPHYLIKDDTEEKYFNKMMGLFTKMLSVATSDKSKSTSLTASSPHHATINRTSAHGTILISVMDSGPGVSKEDQKKLFHEYVQIKPGELQKGQGTGLGLSICKSIIQLHGGNIGMTSEGEGKGSTFYVELPAYRKNRVHGAVQRIMQAKQNQLSGALSAKVRDSSQKQVDQNDPTMIADNRNDPAITQRRSDNSRSVEKGSISGGIIGGSISVGHSSLYSFTVEQQCKVSNIYDKPIGEDNPLEGRDDDSDVEMGAALNLRRKSEWLEDIHKEQQVLNDARYYEDIPWLLTALLIPLSWLRSKWKWEKQIRPDNIDTVDSQKCFDTNLDMQQRNSASVDMMERGIAGSIITQQCNVENTEQNASLISDSPSTKKDSNFDQPVGESFALSNKFSQDSTSIQSEKRAIVPFAQSGVMEKTLRRLNILVADDSIANRKILARLLTKDQHTVVQAGDGCEAIELLYQISSSRLIGATPDTFRPDETIKLTSNPPFDLILMDYHMPNMNGPVAIEIIRNLGYKGVIVGVSGVMDDDANHFIKAGANIVLCKPITLGGLWKALHGTAIFTQESTV